MLTRSLVALLLWVAGLLAPVAAHGPVPTLSENRVWAPAVENQTFTGADRLLSLELHRSNAPPTVRFASGDSVGPFRGIRPVYWRKQVIDSAILAVKEGKHESVGPFLESTAGILSEIGSTSFNLFGRASHLQGIQGVTGSDAYRPRGVSTKELGELFNIAFGGTEESPVLNPNSPEFATGTDIGEFIEIVGGPAVGLTKMGRAALSLAQRKSAERIHSYLLRSVNRQLDAVGAPAVERQALEGSLRQGLRGQVVERLRRFMLGFDRHAEKFRPREAELALSLEAQLGITLRRAGRREAGDFVHGKEIFDVVGGGPGNVQDIIDSITRHVSKVNRPVIDWQSIPKEFRKHVRNFVDGLEVPSGTRIIHINPGN